MDQSSRMKSSTGSSGYPASDVASRVTAWRPMIPRAHRPASPATAVVSPSLSIFSLTSNYINVEFEPIRLIDATGGVPMSIDSDRGVPCWFSRSLASACHHPPAGHRPLSTMPTPSAVPARPPVTAAAAGGGSAPRRRPAHRGRTVPAKVARRAQCRTSARRRVLRLRPEHAAGRRQAGAAAGRPVAREMAADRDPHRWPLR